MKSHALLGLGKLLVVAGGVLEGAQGAPAGERNLIVEFSLPTLHGFERSRAACASSSAWA